MCVCVSERESAGKRERERDSGCKEVVPLARLDKLIQASNYSNQSSNIFVGVNVYST